MPISCLICTGTMYEQTLNTLPYMKCDRCGFLQLRTQDITIDHYHKQEPDTATYKLEARKRNALDRIQTMTPYTDFNNLCDVGTGEGIMLAAAAERGYHNLVGIEPAAYVGSKSTDPRFVITQGDLSNLKTTVISHSSRTVSLFHVIEHLWKPVEALRTIYDALPPGGHLIIETPDSDSYILRTTGYTHDLIYPEHVVLFNQNNLARLVAQAGFTVVKAGRRDFDPPLTIYESLVRLGIRPYKLVKDRMSGAQKEPAQSDLAKKPRSGLRYLIRKLLYMYVRLAGREDYIWLVGKK